MNTFFEEFHKSNCVKSDDPLKKKANAGFYGFVNGIFSAIFGRSSISEDDRVKLFKIKALHLCDITKSEVAFLEVQLKKDPTNILETSKLSEKLLMDIKVRYLFDLWLEDRTIYTKDYEKLQLVDHWAFWLKDQKPILDDMESSGAVLLNGKNASFELLLQNVQNAAKAKLKLNFKEFINLRRRQANQPAHHADSLFNNSAYLVRKGLDQLRIHDYQGKLNDEFSNSFVSKTDSRTDLYIQDPIALGMQYLDRAIAIDPANWIPLNAKAYLYLIAKSPEITRVEHLNAASKIIEQFVGDSKASLDKLQQRILDATNTYEALVGTNATSNTSVLAYQLDTELTLLKSISRSIVDNLKVVQSRGPKQMIRVKEMIALEDLLEIKEMDENKTIAEMHSSGMFLRNDSFKFTPNSTILQMAVGEHYGEGGVAFRIETYTLREKKKKWWSNILVIAIGLFSIFVGAWLIGIGGPFLGALGLGLISSGIGDIIAAVFSFVAGVPMDLKSFLDGKAITLAFILLTAGMAHIAQISFVAKGAYIPGIIAKQAMVQVALVGIGAVVSNVAKHAMYDDDDTAHMVNNMVDSLLNDDTVLKP